MLHSSRSDCPQDCLWRARFQDLELEKQCILHKYKDSISQLQAEVARLSTDKV